MAKTANRVRYRSGNSRRQSDRESPGVAPECGVPRSRPTMRTGDPNPRLGHFPYRWTGVHGGHHPSDGLRRTSGSALRPELFRQEEFQPATDFPTVVGPDATGPVAEVAGLRAEEEHTRRARLGRRPSSSCAGVFRASSVESILASSTLARSTIRPSRFAKTLSKVAMPDVRNTGAIASWIAWAMAETRVSGPMVSTSRVLRRRVCPTTPWPLWPRHPVQTRISSGVP